MKIVLDCFTKKYANFSGRATRKEFWLFVLTISLIIISLSILDLLIDLIITRTALVIVVFGAIVPAISVLVRRLCDTNRSGGWFFIRRIPLIGEIWLLVLLCLKGTKGENSYGVLIHWLLEPKSHSRCIALAVANGNEKVGEVEVLVDGITAFDNGTAELVV